MCMPSRCNRDRRGPPKGNKIISRARKRTERGVGIFAPCRADPSLAPAGSMVE
jgi:hypothetical protein